MNILRAEEKDIHIVAPLMAKFRVEIKRLKKINAAEDLESAGQEFMEYIDSDYSIYIWIEEYACLGYVVCRVNKPVVWVESLYVLDDHRRKGIASALFDQAEQLAASYGEEMVYNFVHPNNEVMISFLRNRGYDVLNLLEIRKQRMDESIDSTITVGNNLFRY